MTSIETRLAKGSFAIAYTVKNEAALLPASIAFHAAAGCSRFYVFWDGTTDEAPDTLRDRTDVVAQNSVSPDRLPDIGALRVDPNRWATDMIVRKKINSLHAATLARADGIEWLLCIDPDELVLADASEAGRDGARHHGSVGRIDAMLAAVPDAVDQVLVPNVEVVPTRTGTETAIRFPFADLTIFQARRPVARAIWRAIRLALLRTLRSPWLAAWFDQGFYRLVTGGRLPQTMRDPRTGRIVPRGLYLGYHSYKAFIRTARARRFDFAVHRWLGSGGVGPRTVRAGLLLHYDLFDADCLAGKFRQRPPRADAPTVRSFLARIARNLDDTELRSFFATNIAVADDGEVARMLRRGAMIEVRGPAAFFEQAQTRCSLPLDAPSSPP